MNLCSVINPEILEKQKNPKYICKTKFILTPVARKKMNPSDEVKQKS